MGGKITLEVTRGALAGQRFEYGEKTRIFIGRQEDCGIVLPESTVSRYHCFLWAFNILTTMWTCMALRFKASTRRHRGEKLVGFLGALHL